MTTPNPARALLAEPRQLAAWALVGYAGLHLVFAFLRWLVPGEFTTFAGRSAIASGGFTALVELALPVLAVLLAAAIAPPVRHAKLIATVAVVEYAVLLFLGVITFLIGLGGFSGADGLDVLTYVVLGLGRLVLAAIAGLVTYQTWARLGGSFAALSRPRTPAPPAA
jgi:hypothetical protein